ncbi:hypothetical protein TRICHSKD4_3725 [Roseibium sp. TrichSKD4]|uniref:hypothetical protein n=1 Tax=Roseibium sp. TrichSKD4 TaxID=744980 RepID=UPI0001E56BD9|nr:hypothetical protein [Roseibium sp. TrichSKD4]EFO30150.1 hypothetical protein TRICHSKD4_3725 [Roseibium sp. TrichSKD4]
MTVLKKAMPWACTYRHQGAAYGVTICHDDPEQLYAQMSAVLDGFEIEGWSAGYVPSAANLEEGTREAENEPTPAPYREWVDQFRKQVN